MSNAKIVDFYVSLRFSHLKRHNAIEHGRANALDLLIKGKPLYDVLNQLVYSLEGATQGVKCAINLLDHSKTVLSPFVAPSLATAFVTAISNIRVQPALAVCAKAVESGELTVCEDVLESPFLIASPKLLSESDIRGVWSQPIIAPDGEVFGTFCMFTPTPSKPDQDDIDSLTDEAQITALVLERANNINQLTKANTKLEQRVAERTKELTESNLLLKKP